MKNFRTIATIAVVLFCFAALAAPANAEWRPTEPITFIVGNHPGGGSDLFARAMQMVIVEYNLLDVPTVVLNIPGGSHTVAYMHMRDANDPHMVAVAPGSYYTTLLMGVAPLSFDELMPVANMVIDPNILVLPIESPFYTLHEVIAYARENPGRLRFAGSNPWSADRILRDDINEVFGVDIVYVPFAAGSDILPAVLGNHVDMAAMGPDEAGEHAILGNMRVLAISAPTRSDILPDVPTFLELGYPIYYSQNRCIIMARTAATPEVLAFYADLFRRIYETETWQEYMAENGMLGNFVAYPEFVEFHAAQIELHRIKVERMRAEDDA